MFSGERKFSWWQHQHEYTEEDLLRLLDDSLFTKYKIYPVVLGLCSGPIFLYAERVPEFLRKFANF